MARKTRSDKGKRRKYTRDQTSWYRPLILDRAKWFREQGFKTQVRKTVRSGSAKWTLFYRWGYGKK